MGVGGMVFLGTDPLYRIANSGKLKRTKMWLLSLSWGRAEPMGSERQEIWTILQDRISPYVVR